MTDAKSYKDEWKKTDNLSKGGQATTFLAESLKEPGRIEVIKLLSQQKDATRRARMFREVTNISTLNHPNITRCIDSNASKYQDEKFELFIVLEYIPGQTLDQINPLDIPFPDKIACIKSILETLSYCHKEGIVHRDIKPDNIILRDGNIHDPVLLDFGLSFNNADAENLTPEKEHVGNRFLILPEQKKGEESKRDERSDITCVLGLLYYLFTSEYPTILLDEKDNKPHQTEKAKAIINDLPQHKRDILNNIFDVGFDFNISKRWQSTQSLIEQLNILEIKEAVENKEVDDLLKSIREKTATQKYQDIKFLEKLYKEVDQQVWSVINEIAKELGDGWNQIQGGKQPPNPTRLEYFTRLAPYNKTYEYDGETTIHAFVTGSELVINIIEGKQQFEAFRQPLEAEKSWGQFKETLKKHYLAEIDKKLR